MKSARGELWRTSRARDVSLDQDYKHVVSKVVRQSLETQKVLGVRRIHSTFSTHHLRFSSRPYSSDSSICCICLNVLISTSAFSLKQRLVASIFTSRILFLCFVVMFMIACSFMAYTESDAWQVPKRNESMNGAVRVASSHFVFRSRLRGLPAEHPRSSRRKTMQAVE